MLPNLSDPLHSYIVIKTFVNGKEVGKDFFDKHPEIRSEYPSQDEVNICYSTVLEQVKRTGKKHKIIITEKGVEVIQEND